MTGIGLSGDSLFKRLLGQPVLLMSIVLFLAVLPVRPEMASPANLENLVLSMTLLLALAIGQAFVLITGGIDLSLPALMSLASVIGASLMAEGSPLADTPLAVPAAVCVMLVLGVVVGALQGVAVAVLRMPALLVSLSNLMVLGGLAVWYTHSDRVPVPPAFIEIWYGGLLGVPHPVWIVSSLALAAHIAMKHTLYGRRLFALGHNVQTSLVSGVPIVRTTVTAYATCGLCTAIAAVLCTARLHTGSPQLVQNEILLDCIGAAVIGGTSLFGGRCSVVGIVLGAFFLSLVGNSLNMLGLRFWHVMMVKGGVILLAALLDSIRVRFWESE